MRGTRAHVIVLYLFHPVTTGNSVLRCFWVPLAETEGSIQLARGLRTLFLVHSSTPLIRGEGSNRHKLRCETRIKELPHSTSAQRQKGLSLGVGEEQHAAT